MASLMSKISDFFGGNDHETGDGLRGLFVTEVQNLYYAERVGIEGMGNSADAATTDEVRNAFLQHQQESRNHVARLEQVLQSIGVAVDEGSCAAADGLAEDTQKTIANTESGSLTRDAGLIIAGQKGEHHEIASYGSLVTLAQVLGYNQAAQLLEQTLQEEKATDKKLTQLAESFVNSRAKSENDDNGNVSNRDYPVTDAGSTYASGQSYSGSQTGQSATAGTGFNSGVSDRDTETTTRYSDSNNATLGGSLGV